MNLKRVMPRKLAIISGALFFCWFGISGEPLSQSQNSLDRAEAVSRSKAWLRLLHYNRTFPFFSLKGRVDGVDFYLSPTGDKDPRAELEAAVAAFSEPMAAARKFGKFKVHAQCAYPGRYRFLKQKLGLKIQDVVCERFDQFISRFNAKSVSFVFSSAYPNNPGSMFGHTFLRINSKQVGDQKKLDLLDLAISYAAALDDDEGGFAFAILGIFGGYNGQFSMIPYYTKVNEYVHTESRDLWEYTLSINEEETFYLLASAWEIETNAFLDYYFFDENCAYVLLALLEVAKPEWNLLSAPIYMAPAEAVKRIVNVPGAVTGVHFRPSLRKKMIKSIEQLQAFEKTEVEDLLNSSRPPAEMSSSKGLDAALTFLMYEKQRDQADFSIQKQEQLNQTLLERSRRKTLTSTETQEGAISYDQDTRPELSHHMYRLGFSYGSASYDDKPTVPKTAWGLMGRDNSQRFFDLHFKFALHDLMNNDLGYTRYQEINFPFLTLRYWPNLDQVRLEQFNFISLFSLFPIHRLEKKVSWRVNLDLYSPKDFGCADCTVLRGRLAAGYTIEPLGKWMTTYLFAGASMEAGTPLREGYRILLGPEIGLLFNPAQPWKLRIREELMFDPIQKNRSNYFFQTTIDQAFSLSQAFEVRAEVTLISPSRQRASVGLEKATYFEAKGTLNYYF